MASMITYIYVGVFVFMSCATNSISTISNKLIYNCFTESTGETCEASRIKICGDFYVCDMVVPLDSPPKRIGFKDGDILFSAGGRTYHIVKGSNQTEPANIFIPPVSELSDKNDNIFFPSDGTSYVIQKASGKDIEIVTSGSYSFNQHALDKEANKLFILSFRSDSDPNDRTGQIYAVTTEPLAIVNDKVNAELVSDIGDDITALAVGGGLDVLLLGKKEKNGGKLIRLKRQKYDPCSNKQSNKVAIIQLLKEVQEQIIYILDSVPEPMSRDKLFGIRYTENENDLSLSKENIRLKRELDITNNKLKMFSKKIIGFSMNNRQRMPDSAKGPFIMSGDPYRSTTIRPVIFPSHETTTSRYPKTTEAKETIDSNSFDISPINCLPEREISRMQSLIKQLTSREKETQSEFDNLVLELIQEIEIPS